MNAELKRSDIIEEAAFKLPGEYAKEWQLPIDQLDIFIAKLKTLGATIQSSNSIPKLKEDTVQLTQAQKELEKIQNQITVAQAKSTDAYIAQKKILNDVNQATKDKTALGDKDAKSVQAQTASLIELGAALAANRKAYENLKGDAQRNSAQGKELKKTIDEQRESYTNLEASLGNNKETVGAYREELEGLLVVQEGTGVGMEGLITKVRALGKAFQTLITNGVFLAFAVLSVAIGAAKSAITAFFETTGEGEAAAQRMTASYDAFFATLKKGFGEVGQKIYDFIGGEKAVYGWTEIFLRQFSQTLGDAYVKAAADGVKLAESQHALNELLNEDNIKRAQNELAADQLTLDSKNKLEFTDKQRLDFAKQAYAIRLQQSAIDKGLAEKELEIAYQQVGIQQSVTAEQAKQLFNSKSKLLTEEQNKQISDAIANIYAKQNDALSLNKRLISEISALEIETDKKETEAIRKKYDTSSDLRISEYDAQIKINDNIIKNVQSTQDEVTTAISNASFLRQTILAEQNEKELASARHAAEDRVKATGIYNAEEIAEIIKKDEILQKEQKRINTAYEQALKDLDIELAASLNTNVFTRLQQDYDNLTNDIKKNSSDQLNALEKTFLSGGKSFGDQDISTVSKYEIVKKEIIEKSNRDILIAQSDFLRKQVDQLNISGTEKNKLYAAISKAEVDITEIDSKKIEERLKLRYQLQIQLQNDLFSASQQIIQNISDSETAAIDKKISAVQDAADAETKAAGDNQNAKDRIAAEAAKKEKSLNDQKTALLRRAAIFEKALSIAQAVINIDEAATKAYEQGGELLGPEFAALVIAAGAVKIAAIASTPIPQYFKGTDSAQGGPAVVGELGTEMFVTPGGELGFTPSKATIMDVEKGTKIYTHQQTIGALAMAGMPSQVIESTNDSSIVDKLDEVKKAISNGHQIQTDYVSNGLELLKVTKSKQRFTKIVKDITMGKWISG